MWHATEHRYHLASVTTELNLAPRLLQLQSYGEKTMGKLLEEIW